MTIAANGAQSSPTVAVRVTIIAPGTSNQPFGTIDTPQQGATGLSGAVAVTGWALDDVAVSKVQIFRDPVSPETRARVSGRRGADRRRASGCRGGISAVPLNNRGGWGMMVLTNQLPNQGNGTFTLYALATDVDGHQAWLGSRSFTSDNANATKPFGAIDTPGLSEIASGTAYPNFGWTLTQQPKVVPFDGSTISVMIDGVVVGHPGPSSPRPDIQAQFPGYANTDNAVGAYVFDTTAYSNGLHTIVMGRDRQRRLDRGHRQPLLHCREPDRRPHVAGSRWSTGHGPGREPYGCRGQGGTCEEGLRRSRAVERVPLRVESARSSLARSIGLKCS